MSRPTVGVIGLGLMGSAMAGNLLGAGYRVVGFDTSPEARHRHVEAGGSGASSVAELVEQVDVVVLSLPNGEVVAEVCLGSQGIAEHAAAGLVVCDTTTGRPSESVHTAGRLAAVGVDFLDVTVSGTSRMAADRDLTAMVGGSREVFEAVRPVIAAFTRAQRHLGPVGSGSQAKLVVNLVVGVTRAVLAEALVLAERADLDLGSMVEVLNDSVASSRVLEEYGPRMVAGDHEHPTSRLATHAKTIGLILESAREHGAPAWFTEVAAEILGIAQSAGMGGLDSTASIEVLRRVARGELGRDEGESPG